MTKIKFPSMLTLAALLVTVFFMVKPYPNQAQMRLGVTNNKSSIAEEEKPDRLLDSLKQISRKLDSTILRTRSKTALLKNQQKEIKEQDKQVDVLLLSKKE